MTLPHLDRMVDIAEAYNAAPLHVRGVEPAWRELAAHSLHVADGLRGYFAIVETDDPEPYADAATMCEDLDRGRFTVTRANSDHPLWSVRENVAFRIVHDIAGHYHSGGDFSWHGENMACGAHEPLLSPLAARALFTECIAQTAYANHFGDFGPQKVVLL